MNEKNIKVNEANPESDSNALMVIGIDHGYGNMKTAHCCFPAAVEKCEKEPTFKHDLLVFEGGFYKIGEGHREFTADKVLDEDYYILTLAALAQELDKRHQTCGRVHIAAGLPLTWVSEQKEAFRAYLLRNDTVAVTFNGTEYLVEIAGADVFPQGFSAVAAKLKQFKGANMLVDIGNGTMNAMYINECRPQEKRCFTEKFGTYQCMIAARESLMRKYGQAVDDTVIERVIRTGTADIGEKYLVEIQRSAKEYTAEIFRRLREHEYDPELMKLYVVGGGSCMVKNFAEYDENRVVINTDVCATAKGYELLAKQKLKKAGVIA